jgi:hypothetical protein
MIDHGRPGRNAGDYAGKPQNCGRVDGEHPFNILRRLFDEASAQPHPGIVDEDTDEARKKGRKLLGEEHNEFKKLKLGQPKS